MLQVVTPCFAVGGIHGDLSGGAGSVPGQFLPTRHDKQRRQIPITVRPAVAFTANPRYNGLRGGARCTLSAMSAITE
jgi:hypothetical protein